MESSYNADLQTPFTAALRTAGAGFKGYSSPTTGRKSAVASRVDTMEIVVIDDKIATRLVSTELRNAIFLACLELLNAGREEIDPPFALALFVNMWNAYYPGFASVMFSENTGLSPKYVTINEELATELTTKHGFFAETETEPEEGSSSKGKEVAFRRTKDFSLIESIPAFNFDDEIEKKFPQSLGRYILALFVRCLAIRPDEANKTGFLSGRLDTFVRMHGIPDDEKMILQSNMPDLKAMKLVYHTLVEFEGARQAFANELLKWHGEPPTDRYKQPVKVAFQLLDGAGWTYIEILSQLAVGCPEAFTWGPLRSMSAQVITAITEYNKLPETTRGFGKVLGHRAKAIPTSNQLAAAVAVGRHILLPIRPTLENYFSNSQYSTLVADFDAWLKNQGLSGDTVTERLRASVEEEGAKAQ